MGGEIGENGHARQVRHETQVALRLVRGLLLRVAFLRLLTERLVELQVDRVLIAASLDALKDGSESAAFCSFSFFSGLAALAEPVPALLEL